MNCDRRCIFSVVFAEASWLSYQVVSAHRLVCRGSNCDRPGLVWPECSKVWCCYVWISWVEGQMVSVSYSKSPPTPNPAGLHLLFGNHVFAEHWCCFVGVYSLQHFTQQSVEIRGQKPLNPAEWGVLCKKKTTTVLLIVISLCGHLEKLSMWLHAIHMTGYLFTVANAESCIFGPRVFWHGVAEWISVLKSSLQLEGDSRRSSRDDLIAGRIIIPSLLPSSEAGISTWSAKDEHEASGKWIIAVHQPVFGITSYYSSKTTNFRCQANMMTPVIMW